MGPILFYTIQTLLLAGKVFNNLELTWWQVFYPIIIAAIVHILEGLLRKTNEIIEEILEALNDRHN